MEVRSNFIYREVLFIDGIFEGTMKTKKLYYFIFSRKRKFPKKWE
ncbi:hypothetical protein SAMN05660903_01094 [Salegentibacter salinarum]|nr:hypothetical protein SAMN05660903_01094 [Salegentibacter salinarum]